jgi:NodT family efflux transporter outer membrane factor (OMF) lipoprotein
MLPRFISHGGWMVALLLAGCASVPDLGPKPEPKSPASLASERSFAPIPAGGEHPAWPDGAWWTAYRDPQLLHLMDEALAGSPSLAAAAARVRAAQGIARQNPGGMQIGGSLEANGGISKQSQNMGIPPQFVPNGIRTTGRIALNLDLDLDLWGKNRAALAAATSEAEAAAVDAQAARLLLTTNLAQAYVDLETAFVARDLAGEALRIREDSLALIRKRVGAGLNPPLEAEQSAAAARAARADTIRADEQIALARNRIAALLGAGPDRGLDLARPAIKAIHPLGAPADLALALIGRRPDIVSARLRAEAAASRIKVARAAFYPNINLSAVVGLQSLGLGQLIDPGSTFLTAGPALSLPLFNQGTLGGRFEEARARYDEAVASYDETLTTALREVADALAGQRGLADRVQAEREALRQAEAAYSAARKRYEAGLMTRIELLSAEDALLPRRQAVAEMEARAFTLDVQLVRALGGGFTGL